MGTLADGLVHDSYAQAALSVGGLTQPGLSELAFFLMEKDAKRFVEKGRRMTVDHLKQEAVKWARVRGD